MFKSTAISTARQKILAFFCLRPDDKFHEREVVRAVALSAGSVHQTVKALEKDQFLTSERKGRMVFYQLNPERPLVRQYKSLAVVFALEPLVMKLRRIADLIVLYGSSVSGEFLSDSDVDLLIVTSDAAEAQDAVFNFGKRLAKEIRPVVFSLPQWMRTEEKDPAFAAEVGKGMILHQSEYYASRI